MKVVIVLITLFFSLPSLSQQKHEIGPSPPGRIMDCLYDRKYTDSIRKTFYPFNQYKKIQLVSFRFHQNNSPIKINSIEQDSLIESKVLTEGEINILTDILYNNYLQKENVPYDHLCFFQPRNAILFFDDKNELKESILICFHCGDYRNSSEKLKFGDECDSKMKKLRAFFISKKVKFGTDLNKESYPGETVIL